MENAVRDEPELPVESNELVELGRDNDHEEIIEDDQEDDEVEKEEEKKRADTESKGKGIVYGDEEMKPADTKEEEDKRKHAELLALPEHGSVVYLGGIPYEASEEDIRGFCECIGEVTEVRLRTNYLAEAYCYAFVTFKTKELACKAIEELNKSRLLKGKKIKCETSHTKCRLLIRNLPKYWGEEDTKKALINIGPGVVSVEIPMDPQNSGQNRGYAVAVYYNNACAEYSRQKIETSKIMLDTSALTVTWENPSDISQVKTVCVTNLPEDITQDDLKGLFDHHGNITKVVVPRPPPAKAGEENNRHGYVHFADRSSALKALNEKYEIGGQVLRCVLAISQSEQRSYGASNHQKSFPLPTYPPQMVYGMVGGHPFDRMGAGYGGGRPFYPIGAGYGGVRPFHPMGDGYTGGRPYYPIGAGYGGVRPFHPMGDGYTGGRPYYPIGAGYGGGRPFNPMGDGYTGGRPYYPIGAGYGGGRPFNPMGAADMSYGMVGSGPSGSLGAGHGGDTGFIQPRFNGWGPTPASMPVTPMLFPGGRTGSNTYVLPQHGLLLVAPQPQFQYGRSDGSSSGRGRNNYTNRDRDWYRDGRYGSSSGGSHRNDTNRDRHRLNHNRPY